MTQPHPFERSLSLESAFRLIEEALISAGINWKVDRFSTSVHAARCTLHDDTGAILAGGHGKGDEDSSLVGAMYEAAEHYWARYETADQNRIVYIRAKDFCRQYPDLSKHLPLILVEHLENKYLPVRQYQGIATSETCLYPLALAMPSYIDGLRSGALTNPRDQYDYRYLARYSSNCGVAIGANRTEAIIHGLLECVEGDALSRFLADVFLIRRNRAPARVDRTTLPSDLSEIACRIEKESKRRLLVFELTNRFHIPVFLALLEGGQSHFTVYGCGASLSRHHALSRSLYEAAQMLLIKSEYGWARDFDDLVARQLKEHPLHLRCSKFEFPESYFKAASGTVPYEVTASVDYPSTIEEYLECLSSILVSEGAIPYTTELMRFDNGISVAHSFFEGQDYFSLVTSGSVVFPQPATVGF